MGRSLAGGHCWTKRETHYSLWGCIFFSFSWRSSYLLQGNQVSSASVSKAKLQEFWMVILPITQAQRLFLISEYLLLLSLCISPYQKCICNLLCRFLQILLNVHSQLMTVQRLFELDPLVTTIQEFLHHSSSFGDLRSLVRCVGTFCLVCVLLLVCLFLSLLFFLSWNVWNQRPY